MRGFDGLRKLGRARFPITGSIYAAVIGVLRRQAGDAARLRLELHGPAV